MPPQTLRLDMPRQVPLPLLHVLRSLSSTLETSAAALQCFPDLPATASLAAPAAGHAGNGVPALAEGCWGALGLPF